MSTRGSDATVRPASLWAGGWTSPPHPPLAWPSLLRLQWAPCAAGGWKWVSRPHWQTKMKTGSHHPGAFAPNRSPSQVTRTAFTPTNTHHLFLDTSTATMWQDHIPQRTPQYQLKCEQTIQIRQKPESDQDTVRNVTRRCSNALTVEIISSVFWMRSLLQMSGCVCFLQPELLLSLFHILCPRKLFCLFGGFFLRHTHVTEI